MHTSAKVNRVMSEMGHLTMSEIINDMGLQRAVEMSGRKE